MPKKQNKLFDNSQYTHPHNTKYEWRSTRCEVVLLTRCKLSFTEYKMAQNFELFQKVESLPLAWLLFGPSTLHLKHEWVMLVSVFFLTTASFSTLYEYTLDMRLILAITIWQSRYLCLRIVCATNSYTWFGFRTMVARFFVAGQYFDYVRPTSDYSRPQYLSLSSQLPFIQKLINLFQSNTNQSVVRSTKGGRKKDGHGNMTHIKFEKYINQNAFTYVSSKCNEYGLSSMISAQYCIVSITGLVLAYILLKNVSFYPYRRALALVHDSSTPENYGAISTLMDSFEFDYNGASFSWFVWFLVAISTLPSIILFGRIILPIPDLVAGSNVLKAMKYEAKLHGRSNNRAKRGEEVPWSEQYRSVITENRLKLSCHVILFRVVENVFLCAWLPVTELSCIVSGICEPGSRIWKRIDAPGIGIKADISMFGFIEKHYLLNVAIGFTAAFITIILLVSQVVTLDKAYLSILGHLNGEDNEYMESHMRRTSAYKKNRNENFIQGKGNNFEKGFAEFYLKLMSDIFSNEIGAQSTSRIISFFIDLNFCLSIITFALCVVCFYLDVKCLSMMMLLFANIYSGLGILRIGLLNHRRLTEVAEEINDSFYPSASPLPST